MAARIQPVGVKVDRLIQEINIGDIKIPAFQRGFVWEQEDVLALLDSIYNDYPIGSILLWNSRARLKSVRNINGLRIPDRDPDYPVNYVLDGQQRLSVIYGVLSANREIDPDVSAYEVDPSIFDILFDLEKQEFVTEAGLEAELEEQKKYPLFANDNNSRRYLKLSALFAPAQFTRLMMDLGEEYVDLAARVQSQFQNYEVPVVTIRERTKEDVGVIFERINNTGTKLSTLDLMVAWTWSEEFDLRSQIDEILDLLDSKGFNDIPEKRILQCLSAIVKRRATTDDILALEPKTVRSNMALLRSSLEKTIDFLATELGVQTSELLPHNYQIVPLTFFFSTVTYPDSDQSSFLKHWFWATSFQHRYAGGTDKKLNEDIEFFSTIKNKEFAKARRFSPAMNEGILIDQQFNQQRPITRAFLILLAQRRPLDLLHGNKVDLGRALAKYNRREYHHIFPRSHLKNLGVRNRRINSVCNFCFLPSGINKEISDRPPSDYLFGEKVSPELFDCSSGRLSGETLARVMESNLLPLDEAIYLEDQYDEFLQMRARLILDFLDSLVWPPALKEKTENN